jgi:hypothetical protein
MTRAIEEIEADLAKAHAAQQDAVEARRVAIELAADLRARAIKGDDRVTSTALAEAEHAVEWAELPLGSKLEAIKVLNAEHLLALTESWADEVSATEPALRADIDAAFADLEAALQRLAQSWKSHAVYVQAKWEQVGSSTVGSDVTPRVRRTRIGFDVGVDGRVLALEPIFAPLEQAVNKCMNDLLSSGPKPSK